VLVCLTSCGFVSGNRARTHDRVSALRTRASRSGETAPYTCAVSPTFRYGAFFFVASALVDVPSARGSFAAVFACLRAHFPAEKIFYDLRLDLRFVWYNGCELNDKDMH